MELPQALNQALARNADVLVPHGPNIDRIEANINLAQGDNRRLFMPLHHIRNLYDVDIMRASLDRFSDERLTFEELQLLVAYDAAVTDIFLVLWDDMHPPNEFGLARQPGVRVWVYDGQLVDNNDVL
jgi:hypothetical protein